MVFRYLFSGNINPMLKYARPFHLSANTTIELSETGNLVTTSIWRGKQSPRTQAVDPVCDMPSLKPRTNARSPKLLTESVTAKETNAVSQYWIAVSALLGLVHRTADTFRSRSFFLFFFAFFFFFFFLASRLKGQFQITIVVALLGNRQNSPPIAVPRCVVSVYSLEQNSTMVR